MHFAKFYEPFLGPLLSSLRTDVLSLAKIEGQNTFLDCCSGAGGMLGLTVPHAQQTFVGIDLSIHMLLEAQKNAPKAHFTCADATCLPFSSKAFDVASICLALHSIPIDMAYACVEELLRVAKCVIIADYCLLERNAYLPAYLLANTIEYLVGGEHLQCYKSFMKIGALEGFLRKGGYVPITRRTSLGGCARIVVLNN